MLIENMNMQMFENESDLNDKNKMALFGAKEGNITKQDLYGPLNVLKSDKIDNGSNQDKSISYAGGFRHQSQQLAEDSLTTHFNSV
jgi:hypothetical protein